MLKIHLRLQWRSLSNPIMEDALVEGVTISHLDLRFQLSRIHRIALLREMWWPVLMMPQAKRSHRCTRHCGCQFRSGDAMGNWDSGELVSTSKDSSNNQPSNAFTEAKNYVDGMLQDLENHALGDC
jgi:hypothetical protein